MLKPKVETVKLLGENIEENLHYTGVDNNLTDMRPKVQATKANQTMGLHQTKMLLHSKQSIEYKGNLQNGKMLANHTSNKTLIYKIYKELNILWL